MFNWSVSNYDWRQAQGSRRLDCSIDFMKLRRWPCKERWTGVQTKRGRCWNYYFQHDKWNSYLVIGKLLLAFPEIPINRINDWATENPLVTGHKMRIVLCINRKAFNLSFILSKLHVNSIKVFCVYRSIYV